MALRFKTTAFPFTSVSGVTANVTTIEGVDATDALQTAAAAAITAAGIPAATVTALGTGSGLSAIPWNPAWDADAQSECADAIAAAGLAPGTGARTCTITVNDGATALEGARIRVSTLSESYVLTTNASGQAIFNLDDATWTVAITLANYQFSGTTLVVNGDESATYSMTAIGSVPSPSSDLQCTGYSYVYDEDGNVESGVSIICRLSQEPEGSGIIVENAERTEVSGPGGLVVFDQLWIEGTYEFRRSGSTVRKRLTIAADDVDSLGRFPIPNFRG